MVTTTVLPRIVLAAAASGQGKTSIATGLMGALRARGLAVAGFKVGPDYIDPGYHLLATGRPGRNLDSFLCGPSQMVPLLLHGAAVPGPADIAVIEGVMGLHDGRLGTEGDASTAQLARLTESPVIVVVDIRHASRTMGAVVRGLADFDPTVGIAGVILNQAASPRHADECARAITQQGFEIVGVVSQDPTIAVPSRHLGLVPAAERADRARTLDQLVARMATDLDLDRIVELARLAPALTDQPWDPVAAVGGPTTRASRPVVAIAGGRAFTFRYAETEELLTAAGCRTVVFDPLRADRLPEGTAGLYLGGGFPEIYAADLAANQPLALDIARQVSEGLPTVAECAGMLYLSRSMPAFDGSAEAGVHSMLGILDGDAQVHRLSLGYRRAIAPVDTLIARAGEEVTGHEFHRTRVEFPANPAWTFVDDDAQVLGHDGASVDGFGGDQPTVHASYLHTHWAGAPQLARRFAEAVHRFAGSRARLAHHGDRDVLAEGLDFAVNVRGSKPPAWLAEELAGSLTTSGCYPDVSAARTALAAQHSLPGESVLPTAGAAEAFTLVARALLPTARHVVVVHPQFTETEAAFWAAGHRPWRHILRGNFQLDAAALLAEHPEADVFVVGNPCNPTGVHTPVGELAKLAAPKRTIVIDEAFADLLGEQASALSAVPSRWPGRLLVVRSLTKTWALAGIRAGFVAGEAGLIAELARQQPPWSVSTAAAVAMVATTSDRAMTELAQIRAQVSGERADLVSRLGDLGLAVVGKDAPFVLIRTQLTDLATRLRADGISVRRADTFPGLSAHWVRLAVRDPHSNAKLAAALAKQLAGVRKQ